MESLKTRIWLALYENDNDALIPEMWAQETLAILEENMVLANIVHRDFENEFAESGDVVNTRKPREFEAKRKIDSEDVTVQDAISDNIPVPLDQHWHVSFTIKDGEETKSFKDLVALYLQPQALAIARAVDLVTSARVQQFVLSSRAGGLESAVTDDDVLDVRNTMNKNKAFVSGRWAIVTPDTETDLLKLDQYSDADRSGDFGLALREAIIGRKRGFTFAMAQNMCSPVNSADITSTTGDGAHVIGATTVAVTSGAGITAGMWLDIDGRPYRATAVAANDIDIFPALDRAIVDDVAVQAWDTDTIDQASTAIVDGGDGTTAGYRAGWHKDIIVDGTVALPDIGSPISFGTDGGSTDPVYTVITVDATAGSFVLDRPLEAAIADGATSNRGPSGNYNFCLHPHAVALVSRPLQSPREGTGALAFTASYKGLGLRTCITYEGRGQGHLVTADLLMGVATLDALLGSVLLGG